MDLGDIDDTSTFFCVYLVLSVLSALQLALQWKTDCLINVSFAMIETCSIPLDHSHFQVKFQRPRGFLQASTTIETW